MTDYLPLNKIKAQGYRYFKLMPDTEAVYFINHYNHSDKTYSVSRITNINSERFIKSNKPVFVNFEC